METRPVRLACGLIGIGKPWGHVPAAVPTESDALRFLESAYTLGLRAFDTSPSYGVSEQRLSLFLHSLTAAERASLTIATKFGEHWDFTRGEPYVDHSYDALRRSLDGSLERLGRIDILQLHKTTPAVLAGADLARAWDYARSLNIPALGASVSDLDSARLVCACGIYSVIQLPFHEAGGKFAEAIGWARARGLLVLVNRPFQMGKIADTHAARVAAFRFILGHPFTGLVLTGTKSPDHLRDNLRAFAEALHLLS